MHGRWTGLPKTAKHFEEHGDHVERMQKCQTSHQPTNSLKLISHRSNLVNHSYHALIPIEGIAI